MSDFAVEFYLRMKQAATGRVSRDERRRKDAATKATSQPFEKGRDPITISSSVEGLLEQFSWDGELDKAQLFVSWAEIVGEHNALNSQPEELSNGQLIVRCKTTAWATQLRLMQTQILTRISSDYPNLKVENIKFVGPDAPSWKKGKFSVPGRGPRDTYG